MRASLSLCLALVSCAAPIEVLPSEGDGIVRTIRAGGWRGLRRIERLPGTGVAVAHTYRAPERLLLNSRGERVDKLDSPADEAPPPDELPGTGLKPPQSWAFDAQTDRIFRPGGRNRFIIVDRSSKEVVCEGELPCKQLGYHTCAQGGIAWVSTEEGEFLHFDIATCKVVGRTRLMDRNCFIRLTISPSRKRLAAVAEAFVSATNHPIVAEIYAIEKCALRRIARTSTTLPGAVWDIALWDKEQVLLFASPYPSHAWEFSADRGFRRRPEPE